MNRLSHGFVFVKHLEPMVRFYEQAFGMVARRSSDAGFVRMEAAEGAGIALHYLSRAYWPDPADPIPPPRNGMSS